MNEFPSAYTRFLPAVRAKARRILGEGQESEDVVSETFLRLWQSGPTPDEEAGVRRTLAWLYRTCTHLAIDALRRRKNDEDVADLPLVYPRALAVDTLVAARRAIRVLRENVHPNELAAAILCRVDACSQAEAAEILGLSERTVRRLITRFDRQTEQLRKDYDL